MSVSVYPNKTNYAYMQPQKKPATTTTPTYPANFDYSGYASQYSNIMPKPGPNLGLDALLGAQGKPPLSPTTSPTTTTSGGGGGSRGGSGSGGGSGAAAGNYNAMAAYLNRATPQYQFQQLALDPYQRYQRAAFDRTMYDDLLRQASEAYAADQAFLGQGIGNVRQQLANSTAGYVNRRSLAAPTVTPEIQQSMRRLAGPDGSFIQAGLAQQNAGAMNADQVFRNLLALNEMAAAEADQSRLTELALTEMMGQQNLAGGYRGTQGAINMALANAMRDYAAQGEAMGFQENQLAQEWAREQAMQNWQGANQANQLNWQAGIDAYNQRLSPWMQLVAAATAAGVPVPAMA